MGSYDKKRYKQSALLGLCRICRKEKAISGNTRCEACWYKRAARSHLGDQDQWERLRDAFLAQQGKCAYTGRSLVIGESASLEHVEPVSRSEIRATDVRNIKWVRKEVNLAKNALSISDLIALCKDVLVHFGYEVRKG